MDEDLSEHGGNYKNTVQKMRQHIYDLENGAKVDHNPSNRSVLLINLKHWNIEVKKPDDEVERLQILVNVSQHLKFDPFILNMRVLIQDKQRAQNCVRNKFQTSLQNNSKPSSCHFYVLVDCCSNSKSQTLETIKAYCKNNQASVFLRRDLIIEDNFATKQPPKPQ